MRMIGTYVKQVFFYMLGTKIKGALDTGLFIHVTGKDWDMTSSVAGDIICKSHL